MLRQICDEIWVAESAGRFLGLEVGTRMTIVRGEGGALIVLSPIALGAHFRYHVDALGPVRAVIAPSLFHHLHVADWMAAYPDAIFAACPGLDCKRPDLAFDCILGDQPHELWAETLQQLYFSARRENEVVFFHEDTGTMICCDSVLNLADHHSTATRWFARLIGNRQPGFTHLERFMVRDRSLARRQVDRMLDWEIERIVLAHGALIEQDGRDVLRRAYAWL